MRAVHFVAAATSLEMLRMSPSLLLMAATLLAILAALLSITGALTRTKIKINTQTISFVPGLFSSLNTYTLLMAAALLAISAALSAAAAKPSEILRMSASLLAMFALFSTTIFSNLKPNC